MSGSATRIALLVASLFAVCLLVVAPFTSATHDHIGDESKDKCLACFHAFLSLEPDASSLHITFQLFALGTLGFSNESEVISNFCTADSVRAPPVA
jgi:hypothetical protein